MHASDHSFLHCMQPSLCPWQLCCGQHVLVYQRLVGLNMQHPRVLEWLWQRGVHRSQHVHVQ